MFKPYENLVVVEVGANMLVICKVCHLDTELWGTSPIKITRANYIKGVIPCGCSKHCRYRSAQQDIVVKRLLTETRYTLSHPEGYTPPTVVDTTIYLNCNICSLDTELFPFGSIKAKRYQLKNTSKLYCGCGVKYCWTEEQNITRVKRKCKEFNLTFLGWTGNYEDRKGGTGIRFKCNTTEIEGSYQNLNKLLVLEKRPTLLVNPFTTTMVTLKGGTIKVIGYSGTSSGNNNYVDVICSVCHQDHELYPEPFKSTLHQLRGGIYPCACKGYKNWSEYEYRVRIKRRLEGLPVTWDNKLPIKVGASSKLKLTCNIHSTSWNTTCIDSLFNSIDNNSYGCSMCAEGLYGYYDTKSTEPDLLYVILFDDEYIKIGRTFDFDRRYSELQDEAKTTNTKILNMYRGIHRPLYDCEQDCHAYLTNLGYYHYESKWTVESFHKESYDFAIKFLDKRLEPVTLQPYCVTMMTHIPLIKH